MKYLKKVLCAALACMLLAGLFVTPAFAFGCNTSDGKEGFSNGGFGSSRTRVSYDALSELCLKQNERLAAGDYGTAFRNSYCTIVQDGTNDFYVIRLSTTVNTMYYKNAAGGVYYTTDRPSIWNSIYGQLWSTYNGVKTDIAVLVRKTLEQVDKITPVIEKLPNYLWGTYNGEKADIGALAAMTVARLDTTNTTLTRITNQLWSTYDDKQTEVAVLVRKALRIWIPCRLRLKRCPRTFGVRTRVKKLTSALCPPLC